MDEILVQLGYFGLFIIAFLSATVIPATTEAFMMAMTALGYSLLGILIIATVGNVLGAVFNYFIGRRGISFLEKSRFSPKPELINRLKSYFRRWGAIILFFSWLPFVGDPLTIVAGLVGVPFRFFIPWVIVGRFLRYGAVLLLGETAIKLFT